MAQTIPTPGSDAVVVSQPPIRGEFDWVDEALSVAPKTEQFIGLDIKGLGEPLTETEQALENPFSKLPQANPKDFIETAKEDWRIGQEGVNIDMAAADISRQVLATDQPVDLTELRARRQKLAKSQYYNQADNLASRAVHGTVQMLPPMAGGQIAGIEKGIERGIEMGTIGGAGFIAGPEFGAATMTGFAEAGVAAGNLEGSFNYWTNQGTGASFLELMDAGVNQKSAAKIAQFVGPAYAAIEYAQVGKLIDTVGGSQLKRGLLRGAMQQLAKVVPEGGKIAVKGVSEVVGKTLSKPLVKGALHLAGDVVEQAGEEAVQGGISQLGTEYGKTEQQLITKGARDGVMEVLSNLDLPETSKQLLSRGFDEFASSVGPMAVLSGGAKGISLTSQASWNGFRTLASGDLNKAAAEREAIARAGAPQTAQALAETVLTEPSSVKPTAETVTPTAPVVAPVDMPALDAELEAAGQAPVEPTQPEAPKPTVGLPGDELGARIFSNIRSRKPIAKTDLDQVGGFSLSSDWKLNEETGNYEYQGPVYERKEAPQVPVSEAKAAPIAPTETKAPETQAVAPIEAPKPQPAQKGAEAVAPTLKPEVDQPTQTANGWLGEVDKAKTQKEKNSLIRMFKGKVNSLSKNDQKAAAIFNEKLLQRQQGAAPKVEAPKIEAPKVEAPKVEAPKIKQPAIPKWEEVQKNKNQIKFLKSVFNKANALLTKEQQITPKMGWKRKDFYSALEKMYGQLGNLEVAPPEQVVPPAPKPEEGAKPTELNEAQKKNRYKLANLIKVFSDPNLNESQIEFRRIALKLAKKVSSQIATQFPNLTDADGEIYNRVISAIATRLKLSLLRNTPVLFNEAGDALPINEEIVKKWLQREADRSGRNAYNAQRAKRESFVEFGGKPAEGAVTQPEAAKEESKPSGMQVSEKKAEEAEEPRATRLIKEAAQTVRDQSSPEAKVVIDWIVSQLTPNNSPLRDIKTYKDLAEYLSKAFKRKVSDKRVGLTVNDVLKKIADNLNESGIRVTADDLAMAISPTGGAAKERFSAEEAKAKAERDERTAKSNLSDRSRNLRSGYAVKERLVEAISKASPENRARIENEVVALAEEDLLEDSDINNRLDNIEKGLPNEKPAVGQPISRRGRRGVKQTKESEVSPGLAPSGEGARGTAGAVSTTTGQPGDGTRGAQPVGARPSRAGQQVGGKQQTTTRNVSVDVKLSENNRSPAVKTLVETATSNGVPVTIQDSPESGSPVGIDINQVEGQEVPIIRVNQNKLKEVRRTLGPKAFAEWTWRAINQEIIHFRHLKLLERLAKEEGTDYKSYLKKEAKRIVQIIKRQRGLRKRIEAIYNNGQKMDDFELAFEFTRMLVEQKMMGGLTEDVYQTESDIQKILRSTDSEGRGFIFRFMELVRDLLYGLTGRTEAETRFLRATADAIINEQRKVMRDLYSPNEKLPVQMNYYTPEDKTAKYKETAETEREAQKELESESALNGATIPFLREYTKELGINEPYGVRKLEIRNEKTGKVELKKVRVPIWKKSDYVKAIKEKLKELGKTVKEKIEQERPLAIKVPMRYSMPRQAISENLRQRYPNGATTLKLIQDGFRTATTRRQFAKVGDIVSFEGDTKRYKIVEIKKPNLKTEDGRAEWEKLEGWSLDYIDKNPKLKSQVYSNSSVQTIFEPENEILGAAMPMRFKTEYAFQQIDRSFGAKKGIFKGLTVDNNNTLPWENLKAKILKGTSKAEANWVLPTMEALVRNGRVNVDMAVEAMQALAKNKITVKKLTETTDNIENQPKEIQPFVRLREVTNQIRHEADSEFPEASEAISVAQSLINLNSYDIFSEDDLVKNNFYFQAKPEMEKVLKSELESYSTFTQEIKKLADKLADAYASFAKELYVLGSRDYLSSFGRSQAEALDRAFYIANNLKDGDEQQKAFAKIGFDIIRSGRIDSSYEEKDERASARYKFVNPKPFSQMKDLREILVKTPIGAVAEVKSHFKDKDVVGFGRMYTTNQGDKTITFLYEAQTDASTSPIDEMTDENHPMTAMDFAPVFEANAEDLKNALQEIVGEKRPIYMDELGNLAYRTLDLVPYIYTIARNREGNVYEVNGDLGFSILEKSKTDKNLANKVKPYLKDAHTSSIIEWTRVLAEAAPLVSAYESLVLKNAIADAVSKNHDAIAITDDETVAMTEGHSQVNDGMRAHYGVRKGSLHNLARKLTGDTGTPFNDGPSMYVYEQEEADRLERPPQVNRYPKKDVTGVSYSLDKVKALGDASDVYNILGAAMPTDRPYWMKQDGEVVEVPEDVMVDSFSYGNHAEKAIEWLNENEPTNSFLLEWKMLDPLERKRQQQRPVEEMLSQGWLRVVGDGFNLYFEGTPNKTQLDKLFESAIEDEVKLIQDQTGLSGRPKSKVLYEPPLEDELGAAMPRLGFSTTEPRFRRAWKELPESMEGLTEFRRIQRGTHDVRLYKDAMGDLFVVKRGQTQEQFENEIAAENVYRIMNYPVPRSRLIKDENGETAKIASWVEGPTLKEFKKAKVNEQEEIDGVYTQIADGLLIDAFLFNYDVIGLDEDNIVIAHDLVTEEDGVSLPEPDVYYTPYRVDNGGTFDIRARGGKKADFFYNSFEDLKTKYPKILENYPLSGLVAQIGDLVLNSDAILNAIPERLRPLMAQRLQYMADQLSAADVMPPAAGRTDKQVEEHFKKLSAEMAEVQLARNVNGELINPKTGLPSRMYLLNSKGEVIGFTPKSEFRYRLERTKSFKMWFGDWENFPEGRGTSDVLDEAGEPRVMYHGTSRSKRMGGQGLMTEAQKTAEELRRYPRLFSTANLFRGIWTSTSRQFAEEWASESPSDYEEQVVIPAYVKSTNTFDPRDKDHVNKLISYLKETRPADTYPNKLEVAMEFGFYDWSYFESQIPSFARTELPGEYFSKHSYPILKAIIDLGFDGLWVREKSLGLPGTIEKSPKDQVESLELIRRGDDKTYEERTTQTLKEDVDTYNKNSAWNHLSFRTDAIKSAMNTGKFASAKNRPAFEAYPEAVRFINHVFKNNQTGWNEFERSGQIYASYDSPENLVTYAYSDPDTLAKANISKTKLKRSGTIFFGRRSAPDVTSAKGRAPTDILGAAMPRRFGVRIKDKMQADAYEKLKNLTYEPIPDSMVLEEAQAYLEKHGIRGAMEAVISRSSPLEHGSRELLAQQIILKLNQMYKETKDARVLGDLIDFTDTFLSITSEAGRALRQLAFWDKLTPEGMLMLYKKKTDESNREIRDRFNDFFNKVKRELSALPAEALDKALKSMEGLLGKADKAAEESRKKLATSNTMTFWENFSKQIGDSLVQKAQEQLDIAEEELARAAGGESTATEAVRKKVENAKTINQAAQEMSRNIKQMFLNLANEQKKNIRDPRVITDEEFANRTDEELEKIQKAERDAKQIKNFTEMLARWPKALQAWQTASDAIRAQTALNPDMADMFQNFLNLVLKTPFTMPQMKRFLSLRGVKLEQLIEEHYQEGKLVNNAYDLAKAMVEEAGLGAWEEEIGVDVKEGDKFFEYEKREEDMAKEEPSKRAPTLSMSQRLTQALANQIMEYAKAETKKKLDRLIAKYADKRLEPSLKRFMNRLGEYQALGLFSNEMAWNEFMKQEGLDKVKPEVVKKLLELMEEARSLTGFRKEEKYADALSMIAYETQINKWNFAKSWWYLSILSGLQTQMANVLGNFFNTALIIAPTIGRHLIGASVDPTRGKAIVGQMMRSLSLSLTDAGYLLTTGRVGTRKSDNPFFSQSSTDFFEVVAKHSPRFASRELAKKAVYIRRVMNAVDMLFYNFNKEVYLFDQAYNMAKDKGLSGSEATSEALNYSFRNSEHLNHALSMAESEGYVINGETEKERKKQKAEQMIRVQEIIDANLQGQYPELATRAKVFGEEATYNEEPKGFLGALHRSIAALAAKYGIVSVPIPFTKIVANVWNQGLDATGYGLIRSGKLGKFLDKIPVIGKIAKIAETEITGTPEEKQAKKDMIWLRGFTGAIAVAIIGLIDWFTCGQDYAFELCVNGPGPKDAAQKELLKNRLGWKPNSVYFKTPIGSTYVNFMLSPMAILLSAYGLVKDNEIYQYYDKKNKVDMYTALAFRIMTTPMQMNFLSGLGDLMEAVNPNSPETALAKAKSFLSRAGSTMVVPNFLRDMDQLVYTLGQKAFNSIFGTKFSNPRTAREGIFQGAFIANTPIIRQWFGQTEYDMLGAPIEMTSRIASLAKQDQLIDVLVAKNALPSAPKKSNFFGVLPMTDEQYATFRSERAKQLGKVLNTPETIEKLKAMKPEIARIYVDKVSEAASQLAKAKVIQGDEAILREAKGAKIKSLGQ